MNLLRESLYSVSDVLSTIIGLSLATGTFAIALLADVTLSSNLFSFKNALSVASAPMEVLISILYWGIRLVVYSS